MQSYGEQSLQVEDFRSGTVRVLGIYAEAALYPRLGIRLGWTLRDIPPAPGPSQFQSGGLSDYQVVGVTGELRSGEGGALVGLLWPTQGDVEIRSSPYHSEIQIVVACDLDSPGWSASRNRERGDPRGFPCYFGRLSSVVGSA